MSLLDTFLLVFDADTTKAKMGIGDVEKATKSLDGTIKKIGLTMAAAFGAHKIWEGVAGVVEYADALNDLSMVTGIAHDDLDAWGNMVAKNGGTVESFGGTIKTLATSISQIDVTGKSRALPFFKELGIAMLDSHGKARPIMELLPELADKLSTMDKQSALGMGRKLGMDEGTILSLMQGRDAIEEEIKLQKRLGTIDKELAESADQFNDKLGDMHHGIRTLFAMIAKELLPVMKKLANGFMELTIWIREHKTLVVGFFGAIAAVVTALYLPAMLSAAAATLAATWPILAIIAVIGLLAAAFAIAYEDITAFFDGQDSLIGRAMDKYPKFKEAFFNAVAAFKTGWKIISTAAEVAGDILEGVGTVIGAMVYYAVEAISWLVDIFEDVGKGIGTAAAWIEDSVESMQQTFLENIEKIIGFLTKLYDKAMAVAAGIKEAFDGAGKAIGGALFDLIEGEDNTPQAGKLSSTMGAAKSQIGATRASGIGATPSGAIAAAGIKPANVTKTNTVNTGPITINTQATDANAISKELNPAIKQNVRQVAQGMDDGVAY